MLRFTLNRYGTILKKKDANVQAKLTSFYFLEKDRKFEEIGSSPGEVGFEYIW